MCLLVWGGGVVFANWFVSPLVGGLCLVWDLSVFGLVAG